MSNILTAEVKVRGVRPMLFHRFGPDAIPLEKQEKTGVAGNDPEEWRKTVLMTSDRQLYIEPSYVFGSLRDGAKFTKRGKGNIQTILCATLQVTDDRILVPGRIVPPEPLPTDPELPVYLDIRMVRNPTTKARNVRYRIAVSSGWELTFNLMWDKTIVSRGELEAVCIDSGRLVGLGNGRGIGFGRFEVESFQIGE